MRHSRGITFIESLIWIAVFMISMMALIVSLLSFYRANTYTLEQAQAVSDGRRAIEKTVQIMREADYGSNGAYPIVAIATSSVTFYADIDSDSFLERVRFYLDGTNIRRGVIEPTGDPASYPGTETSTLIAEHIRNISQTTILFRYFDQSGTEITTFTNVRAVRFIQVSAIVNVSPDRLPNELTIRSSATLRNLK